MLQHHAISLREMCRGFSTSEAKVKMQLMEMQTGWPVDKQPTSSAALSCTRDPWTAVMLWGPDIS